MKKFLFGAAVMGDAVLFYMAMGYTIRGLSGARLIGDTTAHFVGYYIQAIPFWIAFAVLTICIVAVMRKNRKR